MARKLSPELDALNEVLSALSALANDEDRRWVLDTAASRYGVSASGQEPQQRERKANSGEASGAGDSAQRTPKEFLRLKAPTSDVQRVACLAYYLTHSRQTAEFKAADLSKLNTDAAGPGINMPRAVNNATYQSKYLTTAGSGGRKQITSLGEDVVTSLPDQQAVREAELKAGKKKRKKRAKGGKRTK